MVDWIVPFQTTMDRVNDRFRVLLPRYDMAAESSTERQCLTLAARGLEQITEWAQTLIPDEAVWAWVNKSDVFHASLARMNSLISALEVLLMLTEESVQADQPVVLALRTVIDEAHSALVLLQNQTHDRQIWLSPTLSLQAVPPRIVMSVLYTTMSTWVVQSPPELEARLHGAAVIYHPVYTYHLLCRLISSLHGMLRRRIRLSPHSTPTHFEITLTVRGLHLTPALWERIMAVLRSVHSDANLELLYEIGGEIEPLAWDEGQGEGAVVRLPWTTAHDEKGQVP